MSARWRSAAALSLFLSWAWALLGPASAGATVTTSFANTGTITIFDNTSAFPYPSFIEVSGLPGQIQKVKVTLVGLSHTAPTDLDVLLVGPGGQTVLLMSDTGCCVGVPINDVTVTFDDAASLFLPPLGPITSGAYRPTNLDDGGIGTDLFSPSAPAAPYGTTLSVFNGTVANGTWKLFVRDDEPNDFGSIARGWRLTIMAAEPGGALPEALQRVSVATDGTQGTARTGLSYISADGRYVAFGGLATNLTSNCGNGPGHIYVHDRVTAAVTCVSVADDGAPGNDESFHPAMSGDGRFVAFYSNASNLVPGDTNAATDVFVHDRVLGTTIRASVSSGGAEGNAASLPSTHVFTSPAISADGRVVAFVSQATNFASECAVSGFTYIFARDLTSNTTTCVTVGPDGSAGNGGARVNEPKLSLDGRIVAFRADATTLDGRCANGLTHLYVRDRLAGVTECISIGPSGAAGNGPSQEPRVNANGRFVVFESEATNLAFPCVSGISQLFVRDRTTGTIQCVSVAPDGSPGNATSSAPFFSDDGRFVAMESSATNLAAGCTNGQVQTIVRDRASGANECVTAGGDGFSGYPKLSADGRFVAFSSSASNLIGGDTNAVFDVFVAPVALAAVPLHPFDGDRRDDRAIHRGLTGQWLVFRSAGFTSTITWGDPAQQDIPISADFDGDGNGDIAVYRGATGQWFVLHSGGGVTIVTWGDPAQLDVPVAADFDGDGRADITVYRGTTGQWFVLLSGGGVVILTWGDPAGFDIPAPADFDGDGRADFTVYRGTTGQWFVLLSGGGAIILTWGDPAALDVPVPGKYDADNRADITVYRRATGQWFVLNSGGGATILTWGNPLVGDVPAPADFDGDGRTDITVFRPPSGDWFTINSSGGISFVNTGPAIEGDAARPLRTR